MNTLILEHDQFLDANQALLQPRQYEHIKQVLKLNCGDEVRVGNRCEVVATERELGGEKAPKRET